MTDDTLLDAARQPRVVAAPHEPTRTRRPILRDWAKAIVLTAVFTLMIVEVVAEGTDLLFGISVAIFWTAAIALAWELIARAARRLR
jgi:hypothetical protein